RNLRDSLDLDTFGIGIGNRRSPQVVESDACYAQAGHFLAQRCPEPTGGPILSPTVHKHPLLLPCLCCFEDGYDLVCWADYDAGSRLCLSDPKAAAIVCCGGE